MGFLKKIFGSHSDHELKRLYPLADKIDALSDEYAALTDEQLRAKTDEFKQRYDAGESLDDLLPEAFATAREASWRVLGMKPFRVQLIGGIVLGYIWQILLNGVLANLQRPLLALEAKAGFVGLVILMCWQQIGYMMIIYIAGLQAVPEDMLEAAKIDGCPNLVFIVRILIPLTKSAIGAMAVYTFINAYNMYMWPLLVTGTEEMRTVQIGISMLNSVDSQSITMVIAGVVMVILPSLFVFILGQKQLIRGMFSGAVKG